MADDTKFLVELLFVTFPLIACAIYLSYQWRKGLLLTLALFLPVLLVLLLVRISNYPDFLSLIACILVLPFATYFVDRVESRGISVLEHINVTDTSTALVGGCCAVPAFVAWTRAQDPLIPWVLFFIGVSGVITAYESHKLANRCRNSVSVPTRRFQLRLPAVFAITTLAALLTVFPLVVGTAFWFVGAAIYWGGCGLLPASWDYQLTRDQAAIAMQRVTGASALLIGLSFMLLGIASVAASGF